MLNVETCRAVTAPVITCLIGLCILAASGCSRDAGREAGPRPDVVIITLDTTRADHLHAYGNAGVETPHLERPRLRRPLRRRRRRRPRHQQPRRPRPRLRRRPRRFASRRLLLAREMGIAVRIAARVRVRIRSVSRPQRPPRYPLLRRLQRLQQRLQRRPRRRRPTGKSRGAAARSDQPARFWRDRISVPRVTPRAEGGVPT